MGEDERGVRVDVVVLGGEGQPRALCGARVVRRAQALGRYDDLPTRLVTHETGRHRRVLHWRDWDGVVGQTPLTEATVEERLSFFAESPAGPEPLWLWLNESGLPFHPASWRTCSGPRTSGARWCCHR
ncbi:hypothetical protein OHB14_54740 [Streptomyces sp. NBC_01613]|uniref:hypothetical protein n=1 Tax=Streptomyces sp. NBC_01613 TaxID=2975896 RepID=UPI00386763AB